MGIATRNECRALENLPPVEGGDVVTVQMQNVPLASAITAKRDDDGGSSPPADPPV